LFSFIDVAADVSPLIISGGEIRADSRRLPQERGCFGFIESLFRFVTAIYFPSPDSQSFRALNACAIRKTHPQNALTFSKKAS
jgi:hypothetical protein